MDVLSEIIGSKARAELFRLLFERAGTEFYLRELQRQSGMSVSPIQQELARLSAMGLVKSRKDGNRLYYSANPAHPVYPEIRRLVEKTSGAQALIRTALADPKVRFAFIFGSVASGKARPDSDLDLFVIGDLGLRRLSSLLSGLSDRVGRVINPHILTEEEFHRKLRAKDHFVTTVVGSEKTFVIGDEDGLKRLGKKRLA